VVGTSVVETVEVVIVEVEVASVAEVVVVMLVDEVSAVVLEATDVVVVGLEDVLLFADNSDLCLQRLATTPSRPARPMAMQRMIDARILMFFGSK